MDNFSYQNILRIVERVRKLLHSVVSIGKTFSVGKNQFLDGSLLEVGETLNISVDGGTAGCDPLEIIGGCDGGSAAVVNEFNSRTLDFSNHSALRNTNVRTMHKETETIVRNVGSHGSKSSISSKGETRKSTKVEVISVNLVEIIFQYTRKFITAKRGGQKGVGWRNPPFFKSSNSLLRESAVCNRAREVLLHQFVKCLVFYWFTAAEEALQSIAESIQIG
mmetsp:Transcript_8864/g.18543  ORF Transcript_8864/g.18543 Transcript_8864/m.18543 type:complete len:221 (-) Transcript_8864:181-843(-)